MRCAHLSSIADACRTNGLRCGAAVRWPPHCRPAPVRASAAVRHHSRLRPRGMPKHHAIVSFCERRKLAFAAVDDRTLQAVSACAAAAAPGAAAAVAEPVTYIDFGAPGHDILAVAHDPRRDAVYTAGKDHTLRAWNFKTGEPAAHRLPRPAVLACRAELRFTPSLPAGWLFTPSLLRVAVISSPMPDLPLHPPPVRRGAEVGLGRRQSVRGPLQALRRDPALCRPALGASSDLPPRPFQRRALMPPGSGLRAGRGGRPAPAELLPPVHRQAPALAPGAFSIRSSGWRTAPRHVPIQCAKPTGSAGWGVSWRRARGRPVRWTSRTSGCWPSCPAGED